MDMTEPFLGPKQRCRHLFGDGSACNITWREHLGARHGFDESPLSDTLPSVEPIRRMTRISDRDYARPCPICGAEPTDRYADSGSKRAQWKEVRFK
jgi:hypothetical protein